MFLFGGDRNSRQILEVYPWGSSFFRHILTLPFEFTDGTCAYNSGVVYLCFESRGFALGRTR